MSPNNSSLDPRVLDGHTSLSQAVSANNTDLHQDTVLRSSNKSENNTSSQQTITQFQNYLDWLTKQTDILLTAAKSQQDLETESPSMSKTSKIFGGPDTHVQIQNLVNNLVEFQNKELQQCQQRITDNDPIPVIQTFLKVASSRLVDYFNQFRQYKAVFDNGTSKVIQILQIAQTTGEAAGTIAGGEFIAGADASGLLVTAAKKAVVVGGVKAVSEVVQKFTEWVIGTRHNIPWEILGDSFNESLKSFLGDLLQKGLENKIITFAGNYIDRSIMSDAELLEISKILNIRVDRKFFETVGQKYLIELINSLPKEMLTEAIQAAYDKVKNQGDVDYTASEIATNIIKGVGKDLLESKLTEIIKNENH